MSDDEADLTAQLRATHEDPPPAALLAAARAAYSWRTLDTDLCRPSYDSLLDETMSSVRSGQVDSRLIRFAAEGVGLDLEASIDGDLRGLVGQVTPSATAEITVRHGGGQELSTVADELGRFVLDDVPAGPLSVRCSLPNDGPTLYTDWLLV